MASRSDVEANQRFADRWRPSLSKRPHESEALVAVYGPEILSDSQ